MADDVVIRAEGLGKKYVIGHQSAERVPTLRDAISRTTRNLVRTTHDLLQGKPLIAADEVEEFWALKDVNFEIRRGDVVGIIGRNGAGKSTLLKILSRITEPSEGRVEVRGRVASLLEVGTGFHPELTGRENIFLNGAILGMARSEIRHKFDEIVTFAEIGKFLDTPVKRYSSGMYVRLAFAIAAHLETEILIVDEVLAVGDAEFQKKCLGKMQQVSGDGRTVLFVSHNVGIIQQLCNVGIIIAGGKLLNSGPMQDCVRSYLSRGGDSNTAEFHIKSNRPTIARVFYDETLIREGIIDLQMQVNIPASYSRPLFGGIILKSATGQPIWGSNSQIHNLDIKAPTGSGIFRCKTPVMPLIAGHYFLSAWLSSDIDALDNQLDVLEIILQHNLPQANRPAPETMGFMELPPQWSFEPARLGEVC
jgi:lipopolysaccharide transport system ATP-binding protein